MEAAYRLSWHWADKVLNLHLPPIRAVDEVCPAPNQWEQRLLMNEIVLKYF